MDKIWIRNLLLNVSLWFQPLTHAQHMKKYYGQIPEEASMKEDPGLLGSNQVVTGSIVAIKSLKEPLSVTIENAEAGCI